MLIVLLVLLIALNVLSLMAYRHFRRLEREATELYHRANQHHDKTNQAYVEAITIKLQAEKALLTVNRLLKYENIN